MRVDDPFFDVIVAGAGPAGSSSARQCAKAGLSTLLIDKDKFPRAKPCGGAVSEKALSYLDFSLPDELIECECLGARLCFKGQSIEVRKPRRVAVLVSRDRFDYFLLEKAKEAGALFKEGERLTGLHVHDGLVEVSTDKGAYKALYLIGADGVNSVAARHIRGPLKSEEKLFAMVCHMPADDADIKKRLDGVIEVHLGAACMGYGWVFPHRGYFSVGIGTLASGSGNPYGEFRAFLRSAGFTAGTACCAKGPPAPATSGHFIPAGGAKKRRLASDRILLAGDAAGFVDPFIGEGIAYAILSGRLAGETVAESINAKAPISSYEEKCEELIGRNLRYAWATTKIVHGFPGLFFPMFIRDESIVERYLELAGKGLDYKQFLKWLLLRLPRRRRETCATGGNLNKDERIA